nr:hypothetical protein [Tanacetum cinerariifolium]
MVAAAKLPILNPNEFDLWKMRIEQYFLMTDYSLWEVILNGDSPTPTRVVDGVVQAVAPTTAGQKLAKKNELKARGTLLMALPDKHQLKFNIHKDAKSLMEAIEKKFGGNKETKKVQKTLLKLQYENFSGSSSESLDKIHDRLQKLISQLKILGAKLIWKTKVWMTCLTTSRSMRLRSKVHLLQATIHNPQNIAFVSSQNTDSTNESVSVVPSVSVASTKPPTSILPNMDNLSDAVIYSFFASQSNSPQLENDDLKQIDADDLEDIDLKWQMAMLTMRARRFLQRIRRNIGANGTTSIGFVMSKVECYNCHRRGHFAKECRSPKDTRNKDTQRRNIPVETSTSNELVSQCDGVEDIKLLKLDVMLRDNALVELRKKFEKAKKERDELKLTLEKIQTSSKNLNESVSTSLVHDSETVSNVLNVKPSTTKPTKELSYRPSAPIIEDWVSDSEDEYEGEPMPRQKEPSFVQTSKHVKTTRTPVKPIEHPTQDENLKKDIPKSRGHKHSWNRKAYFVCKSLNHLIKDCDFYEKQMVHKHVRVHHQDYAKMTHPRSNKHVVPTTVLTRSRIVLFNAARPVTTAVPQTHVKHQRPVKHVVNKPHSPIRRPINHKLTPKTSNFHKKITTVKTKKVNAIKGTKRNWIQVSYGLGPQKTLSFLFDVHGNPQQDLKDKGVIDSGCSRHITGNISYLSNFEDINRGYVAFGGNPKGGKITGKGKIRTCKLDFDDVYFVKELKFNLFSVSQMCDKKNNVLFTDTKCVVLSSDFKLLDENHVLLRVPRENNMYNVDLKNIVPLGDLTCLFAKATLDESNLWHRRLGHINFKTMNKLVKGNLVRGLPSKVLKIIILVLLVKRASNIEPFVSPNLSVLSANHYKGNQPNNNVGIQENLNVGKVGKDTVSIQQYVLLPLWSTGSKDPRNIDADAAFDVKEPKSEVHVSPSTSDKPKKHDDKTKKKAKGKITAVGPNSTNNTNNFNAAGPSDNAVNMPALEEIIYSDDEADVGVEADFSNLERNITVSPILITRVHKDHPVTQIIGDLSLAPQTRSMTRMEEGIDYEEVFAPVARIEAIRLFLAYASFMGFMVYQMDVKSAFLYGTIEEEVYVFHPLEFEDPDYPDKVYKVVKALYGLHQAPRAWYETLANYLLENSFQKGKIDQTLFIKKEKIKQKDNGIFISQDKYVDKILRKFGLTDGKSASTPIDTEKPLLKDPDGEDVDVHIYRYLKGKPHLGLWYPKDSPFNLVAYFDSDYAGASLDRKSTTGGCQLLGCRLIFWQCKKQTVVATSSTEAEYVAATSCCAQLASPKANGSWNEALAIPGQTTTDDISSHNTKYTSPALTQKVFANMSRIGKGFSGVETPLFDAMLVKQQVHDVAKDNAADEDDNETCATLTQKVANLEQEKIAQALEIVKLKQRVRKLEKKRRTKHSGLKRLIKDTDEAEPAEVEDVLEVVTAAKLMTEVVTTTVPITTAAQVPKASVPRRRRGKKEHDDIPKNMAGFKMDFFKCMTYSEIRPIFEKHYNLNQDFLERVEEEVLVKEKEIKEEGSKRKGDSFEQDITKKQRIDEEAEELKRHLQIVADDVYTEATPLASKEDLETLWKLVKERFESTKPKNFSDDFLLNTLKIMFEKPNVEASVWRDQKGKYGLAKKYPLTHFTLEQMLNNVRLEVEEESEMSLELLSFGVDAVQDFKKIR